MTKKKTAEAVSTEPQKAKKTKTKAKAKKPADRPVRSDALLGKRFTHRKRSEWGIGTIVDGAENAVVLLWSDGTERRTARSYMDQLIELP